jgi:hypothetical protein
MAFYAEWLTDYLTKNPVPLSENQREYVDSLPSDYLSYMAEHHPQGLAHLIADCQGAFEIIEASYLAKETWEQFDSRQRAAWKAEGHEDGYDEEYGCSRYTWEKHISSFTERERQAPIPDFQDIPFRAYISLEIKGRDREGALDAVSDSL